MTFVTLGGGGSAPTKCHICKKFKFAKNKSFFTPKYGILGVQKWDLVKFGPQKIDFWDYILTKKFFVTFAEKHSGGGSGPNVTNVIFLTLPLSFKLY